MSGLARRIGAAAGEIGLVAVLAAIGAVWVAGAAGLPFWEGFAPQSGLLPFVYGLLLIGLSLAVLVQLLRAAPAQAEGEPVRKPLIVLAALTAAVVGVEIAGFGPAVFLLLMFLFAVVERMPTVRSLVVSTATTAFLIGVFRTWLGVPLPSGPLGF